MNKATTLPTPETPDYAIGKDPDRHYVKVQLDHELYDSKLEEYMDRNSLAEGEEGQLMYRIEADPRKDADLRRFTGSSKMILLSCTKAAAEAWERHYARQARAVLRPHVNPADRGAFEGFRDESGHMLESDPGTILTPSGIF